jgi:hypothetical protein
MPALFRSEMYLYKECEMYLYKECEMYLYKECERPLSELLLLTLCAFYRVLKQKADRQS